MVNKLELNKKKPTGGGTVIVGGIGGQTDDTSPGDGKPKPKQLFLPLHEIEKLQNVIYARMVQKVGTKRYWEQWAKDVATIASNYIERIKRLIAKEGTHKTAFDEFLEGVRKNLNPSVEPSEVIEMLAQHMITKPVFEALFENYSFVANNPVSQSLQRMVDLLEEQALEKDTIILSRFYESVKNNVSKIDNSASRQKIITELYEKFFKTAFPKTVEKLGIVYTPIEIVDFINHSVAAVLEKEFNRKLSDENVHILDPFTGTGTFITRMIQSSLIEKSALPRKYAHELHANEIVLLAYYIASINIENAFHDVMGEESAYQPFSGICLTDTFQLGETDNTDQLFTTQLQQNSERVMAQQKAPIRIIVGNPPYSIGQKSANDNAQNQSYPKLEKRIAETYATGIDTTNINRIYDAYIKAFRWSSDRLPSEQGGIIAFVTNSGWLDKETTKGLRKCLEHEFSSIYVFNMRGAITGKIGEKASREGKSVFNIKTGVAITILVKKPDQEGRAAIHYNDIGEYLNREQKLGIVTKNNNVLNKNMDWNIVHPSKHDDWFEHRNDIYNSLMPLIPDKKYNISATSFFVTYSLGIATGRDAWVSNFSQKKLINNVINTIYFFNQQSKMFLTKKKDNINIIAEDVIDYDPRKISWNRNFINDIQSGKQYSYSDRHLCHKQYSPFNKQNFYYEKNLTAMQYQIPRLFPTPEHTNIAIAVPGIGSRRDFSVLISNTIPDLNCLDAGAQCFPLHYYEKKKIEQGTLFDKHDEYVRRDALTDFILTSCRENYGPKATKEDIFYYVYGLLHSPDYRTQFSADLKKMLPRLPLVEKPADFWAFSKAGRELAELHLNYEEQPPCSKVKVEGAESEKFQVDKIRFPSKDDKSIIQYNAWIKLTNIPLEAYDYVVNGRSAIEWIMERYQVKVDKDSGIKNDPNDWATEHNKPRYILDLLLSIVTVSLKTVKIVKGLPKLEF